MWALQSPLTSLPRLIAPFSTPFPPQSLPMSVYHTLIPVVHLANSYSCCSWNAISSDRPAWAPQITHALFTVILNYNYVFRYSSIYNPLPHEVPGKDGPCLLSSSYYPSAHCNGQFTVSKYLLNDWPSEDPFLNIFFFWWLYVHLISYCQGQSADDNFSVHFSLFQELSLWRTFWFGPWQALSESCHPLFTRTLLRLGMKKVYEFAQGRQVFKTYNMVIKGMSSGSLTTEPWTLALPLSS